MKYCNNELDWDCRGINCELEEGHEGDHVHSGTDRNSQRLDNTENHYKNYNTSYEFRWREV